ncbi:XRE family transcriptional regulator [Pseudomonas sp. NMI795_08]|uniref:XRE family transcriptional regulator n=1 Tax=Pseudomonas sp. NMI795_08 TaxID=2903144 RepID=UPI001E477969|nr:LexA family transcriptional regulator [Pseudomonas sp. NMI795_08]MCE1119077.1 LexA family transcriptional regulator [Pseudomonas sp. NMI795_08]
MLDLQTICASRLRQCRAERDWTLEEVARQLTEVSGGEDISKQRYSNWEQGIRMPKPEQILQLAHVFAKPPAWIQGYTDNDSTNATSNHYITANLPNITTKSGSIPVTQATDASAYSREYLKQRGLNANQLLSIRQIDNSMSGVVEEGDEVLLDLSRTTVQGEDLFGIRVNGGIWVRWIRPQLGGSFIVGANSTRYEDQTLTAEQLADLEIVGRVARIAHDL